MSGVAETVSDISIQIQILSYERGDEICGGIKLIFSYLPVLFMNWSATLEFMNSTCEVAHNAISAHVLCLSYWKRFIILDLWIASAKFNWINLEEELKYQFHQICK